MPRKKEKNLLVLIDYDNIDSRLMNREKKLDFAELMIMLVEIGKVKHAFVFMPFQSYHGLENINNLGYEIIICQKMDILVETGKREDKVDTRMQMLAEDFLDYKEITDVVILTHDRHSIETASKAVKHKKIVSYFAIKNEMAKQLQDFIKNYKLEVYELPTKNRY